MENETDPLRIPFPHLSKPDAMAHTPTEMRIPDTAHPRAAPGRWSDPWCDALTDSQVQTSLIDAVAEQSALAARLTHDARVAGAVERLALDEVADAMWLGGDAGARDRLPLYAADVQAAQGAGDQLALWALRRLTDRTDPATLDLDGLRAFLGLHRRARDTPHDTDWHLFPMAAGEELDSALQEWLGIAALLAPHHPLVRGAVLFRAWRWLGISAPEDIVTPLTIANRVAGQTSFAPLAGAARRLRMLSTPGDATDKLKVMFQAFAEGAREASLTLERLALWQDRAQRHANTKAERAVLDSIARHPVVSTRIIAQQAGMTPQAINAAARALHTQGILNEATGNTRFRLWRAAM